MKIDSVEAIPLTARLKKAQTTSQASYTEISICLVKVRTDEGIEGYGNVLRVSPLPLTQT
jgi:L-alanine-DL-glutamate epimerase-like enolase superfamily enzyme